MWFSSLVNIRPLEYSYLVDSKLTPNFSIYNTLEINIELLPLTFSLAVPFLFVNNWLPPTRIALSRIETNSVLNRDILLVIYNKV